MRYTALNTAALLALSVHAQETEPRWSPPEGPLDLLTEAFEEGIVGPANRDNVAAEWLRSGEWTTLPPLNYVPPPYAQQTLEGMRICLDPGHGGEIEQSGYKRGGSGFRESVMNLEVGHMLREFLETSGAEVMMTRTTDQLAATTPSGSDDLQYRARLADRENCHLFISLHHNATSRDTANYLSVWYHARPDVPTANTDLARWIVSELNRVTRLPEWHHAGLYSDWLMYPPDADEGHPDSFDLDRTREIPSGFGVLRQARVPAVLVEGSFYTNRDEELRLMDREYLRREAWGIYSGIVEYLWAGIPGIALHEHQSNILPGPRPTIHLSLDDGMHEGWNKNNPPRIHLETLRVYIDDERAHTAYIPARATIEATPRHDLAPGWHSARVRVLNAWGNWSWPTETPFYVE